MWKVYRKPSLGYKRDPPVYLHPSILVGAGEMLTPTFAIQHHITHVINCAYDEDSPAWFRKTHPEKYYCVNAHDGLEYTITNWYPFFRLKLQDFLRDPGCQTVFIHCQCGINRSMFLALIYVCLQFGYDMEQTVRTILAQRPCCLSNTAFQNQAETFVKNAMNKDNGVSRTQFPLV